MQSISTALRDSTFSDWYVGQLPHCRILYETVSPIQCMGALGKQGCMWASVGSCSLEGVLLENSSVLYLSRLLLFRTGKWSLTDRKC